MPQGLQCFDEAGNVILDQTTRVGRVFSVVPGNQKGGSISDAGLRLGRPWANAIVLGAANIGSLGPQITIDGTTITYTSATMPFLIAYGTF